MIRNINKFVVGMKSKNLFKGTCHQLVKHGSRVHLDKIISFN